MYPVYPTIAFAAAITAESAMRSVDLLAQLTARPSSATKNKLSKQRGGNVARRILTVALVLVASLLFASRITSNYINYKGGSAPLTDTDRLTRADGVLPLQATSHSGRPLAR